MHRKLKPYSTFILRFISGPISDEAVIFSLSVGLGLLLRVEKGMNEFWRTILDGLGVAIEKVINFWWRSGFFFANFESLSRMFY